MIEIIKAQYFTIDNKKNQEKSLHKNRRFLILSQSSLLYLESSENYCVLEQY